MAVVAIFVVLTSCSESSGGNGKSISGVVTDSQTGNALYGVLINASGVQVSTNSYGQYSLGGLKSGTYAMTFSKDGYQTGQTTVMIMGSDITANCQLVPVSSSGSSAIVAISDYVTISDGIYYYFTPSSNVKKYYWTHYKSTELPGESTLAADIISKGVEANPAEELNEGYSFNLTENTKYVICMVAIDKNNGQGIVTKKEITTKSSQNQPMVTLTINSISGSTVNYSAIKNSYCSSYVLCGYSSLTQTDMEYPDIIWAMYAYEGSKDQSNIITQNQTNDTFSGCNGNCILISLGFTSGKINGGVISKQSFVAGQAVTSASVGLLSQSINVKTEGRSMIGYRRDHVMR